MAGLQVGALRTHKVAEFEGDGLVVSAPCGGLQFHTQLVELDGQEVYRHITVETFRVGPALHPVFVGEFLVNAEKGIQLVVINMSVLKCTGIYNIVYSISNSFHLVHLSTALSSLPLILCNS